MVPIDITMVSGRHLEFKNGRRENLLSLIYQFIRDVETWSWCQNQLFRVNNSIYGIYNNPRWRPSYISKWPPCKYSKIHISAQSQLRNMILVSKSIGLVSIITFMVFTISSGDSHMTFQNSHHANIIHFISRSWKCLEIWSK